MPRIAGVDLPTKQTCIALTYIYGIGRSSAVAICKTADVDPHMNIRDLNNDQINQIRHLIENEYMVEGRLRTTISMNIKRLLDIGCYRGLRHRKGLPVQGQRTRTNARTRKGKRKTVAGKRGSK